MTLTQIVVKMLMALDEPVTAKHGFAVKLEDILENPSNYDPEELMVASFALSKINNEAILELCKLLSRRKYLDK